MSFKIDTKLAGDFFTISISGELRKGAFFDQSVEFPAALQNARARAKDHIVIVDLTNLVFWSTAGMTQVISTVADINKERPKRAGIIAPRDSVLFVQAKKVLESVGTQLIPWKKDEAALIQDLTA